MAKYYFCTKNTYPLDGSGTRFAFERGCVYEDLNTDPLGVNHKFRSLEDNYDYVIHITSGPDVENFVRIMDWPMGARQAEQPPDGLSTARQHTEYMTNLLTFIYEEAFSHGYKHGYDDAQRSKSGRATDDLPDPFGEVHHNNSGRPSYP